MKQKKAIKISQLAMLFVVIVPVTKLMLLPAILGNAAGVDSWASAAVYLALDMLVLLCILQAVRLAPDKNFFQLCSAAVGKTGARILLTVYAVYLLARTVMPVFEQRHLWTTTLYDTMPRYTATVPLLLVLGYVSCKGLNTLARCANISVWFTGGALAVLFLLSVTAMRLDNLLPVFGEGAMPFVRGLAVSPAWFGDYMVVLAFLGGVQAKNGKIRGAMWGGIAASVITLLFLLLTVGVFGNLLAKQQSAITKISKFNVALSNIGRIDWYPILLLMVSVFFSSAATLYAAVALLQQAYHIPKRLYIVLPLIALTLVAVFVLGDDFTQVYNFLRLYLGYAAIPLQYLLPPLVPLLAKHAAKKEPAYA